MFIEQLSAVLGKRLIELPNPQLPHRFHCPLSFRTEFQSSSPFIECVKKPTENVLAVRGWKHTYASLHEEIFVKQKHFRTDARFIRRRIVGQSQPPEGFC